MMGRTFERILTEAEAEAAAGGSEAGSEGRRQAEIAAARRVWREGFVAQAIVAHCKQEHWNDGRKEMESGLLTMQDFAGYSATIVPALTYNYCGWTVGKCGAWSQAPVFLQQLALLKGLELDKMAPDSPEFIHTVVEAAKLAFADREAYYTDPEVVQPPLDVLLSDEYNAVRRKLIDPKRAAGGLTPGLAGLAGGEVDGAGDGSQLLSKEVRAMYDGATAEARLTKLEEQNVQLKQQLEQARKALDPPAAAGGVRAAAAAATSGGGVEQPEHPFFEPEDEFGNPTSYFSDRWDPIHKK